MGYIHDTPALEGAGDSSTATASDFHGGWSMEQTIETVTKGQGYWKEAADAIHKIAVDNKDTPTPRNVINRRPRRAVAGSRAHVPAALAGTPKAMVKATRAPRFKPVLRIAVPLVGNCNVDAKAFFNRGAAILSAIKALDAQGVQVEVIGYLFSRHGETAGFYTVPLKRAEHRLAAADLSYALCHPTVTRRIYMALLERSEVMLEATQASYGQASGINEELLEDFDVKLDTIDSSHYNSKQNATKNIERQFKEQLASKAA